MTEPKPRKSAEISTPQSTQTKMIPLHVADQAVAACEAEIKKLQEENARLRAASFVTAVPVEQYERVVDAGYAMAIKINVHGIGDKSTDCKKLLREWTEAVKGAKQS